MSDLKRALMTQDLFRDFFYDDNTYNNLSLPMLTDLQVMCKVVLEKAKIKEQEIVNKNRGDADANCD